MAVAKTRIVLLATRAKVGVVQARDGATYKEIGVRVGAAPSLVGQCASRHWPARDKAMAYQPGSRKRDVGPRPLPPGGTTLS